MRKIIYYVASSLDGYISGLNEDISMFNSTGNGVEKYLDDLKSFDTVIMGRKTYEFGYKHGLQPGSLAYPHMDHYIFSGSLNFQKKDEKLHIKAMDISNIISLKKTKGSDIYLCGGGEFAGWLLDHGQIDKLKLKLNPIILGDGVKLFGSSRTTIKLQLISSESYEQGLKILDYQIDTKSS